MSRKGQEIFFLGHFQTEESFVLHMSPTLKLRVSLISLKPRAEMQGEVSLPLPMTVSVTRGAAHSRTLIPHLTSLCSGPGGIMPSLLSSMYGCFPSMRTSVSVLPSHRRRLTAAPSQEWGPGRKALYRWALPCESCLRQALSWEQT